MIDYAVFLFQDLETKGGIVTMNSKFKSHYDAVEQELKTSTIGKLIFPILSNRYQGQYTDVLVT